MNIDTVKVFFDREVFLPLVNQTPLELLAVGAWLVFMVICFFFILPKIIEWICVGQYYHLLSHENECSEDGVKIGEYSLRKAELEVRICLNYGGISHAGGPTSNELEWAYYQGDIEDEISHMRRFALAINSLADELEK